MSSILQQTIPNMRGKSEDAHVGKNQNVRGHIIRPLTGNLQYGQ